jgi:hypothetical protein
MHVGAIVWRQNTSSVELLCAKMFGNVEFETRKDRSTFHNFGKVCEQCRGLDVYYFTGEHCERVECERNPILCWSSGLQHLQGCSGSVNQVPAIVKISLALIVVCCLPSFGRQRLITEHCKSYPSN